MAEQTPTPTPTLHTFSGIVYHQDSQQRLSDVTIRPIKGDNKNFPLPIITDKDGRFNLKLAKGKWQFEVLHFDSQPTSFKVDIEDEDVTDYEIRLIALSQHNQAAGLRFFTFSIFTLLALFAAYIFLHNNYPQPNIPLSLELLEDIENVEQEVKAIQLTNDSIFSNLGQLNRDIVKTDQKKPYFDSVYNDLKIFKTTEIPRYLDSLKKEEVDAKIVAQLNKMSQNQRNFQKDPLFLDRMNSLDSTLNKVIKRKDYIVPVHYPLLQERQQMIRSALPNNNAELILKKLDELKEGVKTPPTLEKLPWTLPPWNYLEILFWALAGILSSKILTTGYYLRRRRFYQEGIYMHLSHIVAIPFMVLVAMILLSLISFEINISGGTPARFSLADPSFLAAFSFILAAQPWEIWDFIKDAGQAIRRRKDDDSTEEKTD